ncbi:pyridoxamine 5'-phosphate oxidase family protein [Rouxiella badensis]|jgi:predicted pyridoxine 5'-phosphate oxidase superfamily flavin-nucleotide-binding protein|nr:pyridoxamine 5'-phosphate oxidase family protein [Rouxiella badensis]MCC3702398.1 pyridoxamine 5'-phosphate oxidase family protein [Rouxiella badensis]QII39874.1 pyridoxamine 5'-phosphate oxidase [Rouxiella badensis]
MMDIFHADEKRAQMLAGFNVGAAGIYPTMPQQHRDFFAGLRSFYIATLDERGWPVATVLNGPPGFISSVDNSHLRINVPRREDCPALSSIACGQVLGALGLDFTNRRRNRVNGVISRMDKNRLEIAVQQSFGNCPKYIQRRQISPVERHAGPIVRLSLLDAAARELIHSADTFFVATHAHSDVANGGADMSHRGGNPGFVKLVGDTLWVPDFSGNRYMNTLGNMLAEPRAALLFLDFNSGDVLHLQGNTEISWQDNAQHGLQGAERYWCLHISTAWRFPALLPWRGTDIEYSPATLSTGVWA